MSRTNRRRAELTPAAVPAPVPGGHEADPDDHQKMLSWRHIGIGFLAGEATLLVLGNLVRDLTDAAFGTDGLQRVDGGVVGVTSLLSVILGAFVASRLAGRGGIYQGIWVGVGFIAVSALYQAGVEANVVHASLQSGSHRLVDLGPMNMGDLISGDFLALFGGSFGGWLGDVRGRRGASQAP